MLVWIDLETTGLEPDKHVILEVACIVTDDNLTEIAAFAGVTNEARRVEFAKLDPVVQAMHLKNGLWLESLVCEHGADEILAGLIDFIEAVIKGPEKPELAGSTISFDRAFLKAHAPSVLTRLHYRNLDVTALNQCARRWWPEVHEGRPQIKDGEEKPHRALDDIRESINVLRYYRERLGPVVTVVPVDDGPSAGFDPTDPGGAM